MAAMDWTLRAGLVTAVSGDAVTHRLKMVDRRAKGG
jgi:hypothetical protein